MYLIIPLILIVTSLGGALFIIWRKLPHLKELTMSKEVSSNGFSLKRDWWNMVYDFCPEVVDSIKNIRVDEYKEMWLVEMEKFLRRLRVVSLKTDRLSGALIKKIRKNVYSSGSLSYAATKEEKIEKNTTDMPTQESSREEFKKTEQRLILEIAKNPKNAVLYEELGDLYARMGDYKDAKESYEAAIELNSNSEGLKKKLSLSLEKLTSSK